MSRIYDALKQSEKDGAPALVLPEEAPASTSAKAATTTVVSELVSISKEERLTAIPNPKRPLPALIDDHGMVGEKFRMLSNRLAYIRRNQKLKVIQITSGVAGEGKSLVAANLAIMLARRDEERVVLLEGDVRRPTQLGLFGVGSRPGLGQWWEDGAEGMPKLYRINDLRLWMLPAGTTHRPAEMLQSGRIPELVSELRQTFDWVIIDSPPMLPLADTNIWARLADGTLLVVREGISPKRALQKGLESLDNPKVIGIVLNDATEGTRSQYYSQYYGVKRTEPPQEKAAAAKRA